MTQKWKVEKDHKLTDIHSIVILTNHSTPECLGGNLSNPGLIDLISIEINVLTSSVLKNPQHI